MFRFIQCTPTGGDCCAGYRIDLDKEYTVESFINTVLSERTNEWGDIGIRSKGKAYGIPQCCYRYGKIATNSLPKEVLSKGISNVSASGGWTRMDYILELQEG